MLGPDAPWAEVLVLTLALFLIAGGCIAAIALMVREERARRRSLRKFDARVGRDVWTDRKGLTK